jgi:hypothetical protein
MMGRIYLAIITALIGIIIALGIHIKGLWFIEGLEDKLEKCRETVLALGAEGKKAEAVSGAIAKGEGTRHAENVAVTLPAARRFIERNRLRPQVPGAASSAAALSGGAGPAPAVPELGAGSDPGAVPGEPGPALPDTQSGWVAVREEDVLVCTGTWELAWTGYSTWQKLKAEGLAVPEPAVFPEPALSVEPQP